MNGLTRPKAKSWNPQLIVCLSLLSGCYLKSKAPEVEQIQLSERDLKISRQINDILSASTDVVRDMSRLTSFVAGAVAPAEDARIFTDLPEYTTLFTPVEEDALLWKAESPNRFSREIWNECVYLLQLANPNFRMRAEGKLDGESGKMEALVLAIDTGKEVTVQDSEAVLSARPRCIDEKCTYGIRIDHKAIAKALRLIKTDGEAWSGTSGSLVANVTESQTDATMQGFILTTGHMSLNIASAKYTRARGTEESLIEAHGRVQFKHPTTDALLGPVGKNFTVKGNLRNPSQLEVVFTDLAEKRTP